ncbi:MAG: hypothetical protein KAZ28_01270 [Bacteroidaceae bacterium]|nr:hypothetical protein [Bacteroidaceae bacterium]
MGSSIDVHPPFLVDGKLGCSTGFIEMVLLIHDNFVYLLPALPDVGKMGMTSRQKQKKRISLNKE